VKWEGGTTVPLLSFSVIQVYQRSRSSLERGIENLDVDPERTRREDQLRGKAWGTKQNIRSQNALVIGRETRVAGGLV